MFQKIRKTYLFFLYICMFGLIGCGDPFSDFQVRTPLQPLSNQNNQSENTELPIKGSDIIYQLMCYTLEEMSECYKDAGMMAWMTVPACLGNLFVWLPSRFQGLTAKFQLTELDKQEIEEHFGKFEDELKQYLGNNCGDLESKEKNQCKLNQISQMEQQLSCEDHRVTR